MDRELTSKEKWQDRRKVIIRWGLGTGAAVVAVVLLAVLIQPSVRESSLRLATVDTGSIEFAVSATGKVVPGYEEIINSPITSRVMEVYKRAGEVVQAGECRQASRCCVWSSQRCRPSMTICWTRSG